MNARLLTEDMWSNDDETPRKFKFKSPCTVSIVGPTCSGKTCLMYKIIEARKSMFSEEVNNIYWFYNTYQDSFDKYEKEIQFFHGLEQLSSVVRDNEKHSLIILDDLLECLNLDISKLFTQLAHHRNISVFFLSQILFPKNPIARTISLNLHYLILFKNKRDTLSISRLGCQLFPGNVGKFINIYKRETAPKFGYLLINVHPESTGSCPSIHKGILPHEMEKVFIMKT